MVPISASVFLVPHSHSYAKIPKSQRSHETRSSNLLLCETAKAIDNAQSSITFQIENERIMMQVMRLAQHESCDVAVRAVAKFVQKI